LIFFLSAFDKPATLAALAGSQTPLHPRRSLLRRNDLVSRTDSMTPWEFVAGGGTVPRGGVAYAYGRGMVQGFFTGLPETRRGASA